MASDQKLWDALGGIYDDLLDPDMPPEEVNEQLAELELSPSGLADSLVSLSLSLHDSADRYEQQDPEAAARLRQLGQLLIRPGGAAEKLLQQGSACTWCNDARRVWIDTDSRYIPCTRCPVPCPQCNEGGYCRKTPCSCDCHREDRDE